VLPFEFVRTVFGGAESAPQTISQCVEIAPEVAGASGWCTAAPNLRPQPCLDLYAATQAGDYAAAKAIYEDLSPLLRFIVAGGLPTTVKAGLNLLGTHVGDPRPPLLPLDEAGLDEMRSLLID
jgi:4-hydroxy-tetrahydrodipicolinate synthase